MLVRATKGRMQCHGFSFFSTLFILSRFLHHDIMGLMGGDDYLHTLIQVLPGLLAVHLLQK